MASSAAFPQTPETDGYRRKPSGAKFDQATRDACVVTQSGRQGSTSDVHSAMARTRGAAFAEPLSAKCRAPARWRRVRTIRLCDASEQGLHLTTVCPPPPVPIAEVPSTGGGPSPRPGCRCSWQCHQRLHHDDQLSSERGALAAMIAWQSSTGGEIRTWWHEGASNCFGPIVERSVCGQPAGPDWGHAGALPAN